MTKHKPSTIRLSDTTKAQLDELKKRFGLETTSAAIATAAQLAVDALKEAQPRS